MRDEWHPDWHGPAHVSPADPFHRHVAEGYRTLERPAPRHVPGCTCALCSDRARLRRLYLRPASEWQVEDVLRWCDRATFVAAGNRGGADALSGADGGVFRFLLPRILELLAAGGGTSASLAAALRHFAPARGGALEPDQAAFVARFGALLLDRSMHDPDWPQDLFGTMHLLVHGGWPLGGLLKQAVRDPDLPAALARAWGRGGDDVLFPQGWPPGVSAALCKTFVTGRMAERMMDYAMAEGTGAEETHAAMRAADLLLRNI